MITIEIPGPPQGKQRPFLGQGRVFSRPETVNYEALVKQCGQEVMAGRAPLEGPLELTLEAFMAMPKGGTKAQHRGRREGWLRPTSKPDFDNLAKMVDGLNGIVWVDDKQVVRATIDKIYSDRPRMIITVQTWSFL